MQDQIDLPIGATVKIRSNHKLQTYHVVEDTAQAPHCEGYCDMPRRSCKKYACCWLARSDCRDVLFISDEHYKEKNNGKKD